MAIGQHINIKIDSIFEASGFKKAQKEFESVQDRFQDLNSTFSTAKGIVRMNNRMDEMQAVARDAGLEMDKMGRFFEEGSRDADKLINSFKELENEDIAQLGEKNLEKLKDDFGDIGSLARAATQETEVFKDRLQDIDGFGDATSSAIAGPLQSRLAGGLDEGDAIQQLKGRMESLSPIARRLGTSVEEVAKASQKTGLRAENLSTIAERTGSSMKEIVNASNMTQRSLIELSSVSQISGDGIEDVAQAAESAGLSASKLRNIAELTESSMREVSEVAEMTDNSLMSLAQISNASGNSMRDIAQASRITGLSMSKASQVADRSTHTLRELKQVADSSNRSVMQLSSAYDRSVGSVTNVARAADRLDSSFGEVSNTLRQSNRRLIEMGGSLRVLDTATGNVRDLDEGMRQARNSTKMFNFEFLSTMFIGMQFARIFSRMMRPALEMTGIMEQFRTTMEVVQGPFIRLIADAMRPMLNTLQELPKGARIVIGLLTVLGFIATKVAFFFSQLQLGFQGMSMAANKSGSSLLSFKGILDAVGLTFLTSSEANEQFNYNLGQTDDAANQASAGLSNVDDAARSARTGMISLSTAMKGAFLIGALLPVLDVLGILPDEMNKFATVAISLASVMPLLAESNFITASSFKDLAVSAKASAVATKLQGAASKVSAVANYVYASSLKSASISAKLAAVANYITSTSFYAVATSAAAAAVAIMSIPLVGWAAAAITAAAALFKLSGGLEGIKKKVSALFEELQLGEFGAQLFSGAIRGIGNALSFVYKKSKSIGGSIVSSIGGIAKKGKKMFMSWFNSVREFASKALPKMVGFIKKHFGKIVNSSAIKKVKSFLVSLFKDPVGTIRSIFGRVKEFVVSKIEGIMSSGPVQNTKKFLKNIFGSLWSTAKEKLGNVKTKVKNIFKRIKQFDVLDSVKNAIENVFSNAKSTVVTTMSNLKSDVVNAWENMKSSLADIVPDLDINIPGWLESAIESGGEAASSAFDFMGGAITAPMSTDKNDFLVSDGRLVPFSSQDMIMGMKDPARLEASGGGQGTNVVEFRPETQINITAEEQVDVDELKDELGDRWISELEQKLSSGI